MRLGLLLCLAAAACSDGGGGLPNLCEVRTSLIDHDLWTQLAPEDDPWAVAGRERCTDERMRAEPFETESSYTIETRGCSWGTVEQPSRIAVRAGEPINYRMWYFSQTNFEVAEAEIMVAQGDQPLWTQRVPLPSPEGGLRFDTIPAPRDIAAGEILRFHAENHGTNSWNLLEVSVTRMEPCQGGN
jgi:hypothetical protein